MSDHESISPLDELTPKQARFVELVAGGASYSDAYRASYATNGSDNTVNVAASKLMKNEKVKTALEAMLAGGHKDPNNALNERWVLERLKSEADNARNSGSVRVRALELLGKYQGMFEDSGGDKQQRTPDQIRGEIERYLKGLGGPKDA